MHDRKQLSESERQRRMNLDTLTERGGEMPYYDNDTIEEVRSRNDIVDVISQYVHLQKKARPTLDFVLFIVKNRLVFFRHRRSRCIILAVALAAMSLRF